MLSLSKFLRVTVEATSHLPFYCQAEDGIRYWSVTGVQTCALPISAAQDALAEGRADQAPGQGLQGQGRQEPGQGVAARRAAGALRAGSAQGQGHGQGHPQGHGDRKSVVEGKRVESLGGPRARRTNV